MRNRARNPRDKWFFIDAKGNRKRCRVTRIVPVNGDAKVTTPKLACSESNYFFLSPDRDLEFGDDIGVSIARGQRDRASLSIVSSRGGRLSYRGCSFFFFFFFCSFWNRNYSVKGQAAATYSIRAFGYSVRSTSDLDRASQARIEPELFH